MTWTEDEIPDLTGRTYVVTGANGGIGEHITAALAVHGARVVMACRNASKAESVAKRIGADIEVEQLDLGDLASIRSFAEQADSFDVLINNAGLLSVPLGRTADGFESQFGVNHLGHFALTGLLLDRISDRVVTLSSVAHKRTKTLDFNDLNYENRPYDASDAYVQAKLCNLMFARELQRRLSAGGSSQKSFAVHPGVTSTALDNAENLADRLSKPILKLVGQQPRKAAESTLFASTQPDADPETYWGTTGLMGVRGPVGASTSSPLSQDKAAWGQLWAASEKLTGVTFPF